MEQTEKGRDKGILQIGFIILSDGQGWGVRINHLVPHFCNRSLTEMTVRRRSKMPHPLFV